jgi:hypothetical protein
VLLAMSRRGYGNLSMWITVARRRAAKGSYVALMSDIEGKVPNTPTLAGLPDCLAPVAASVVADPDGDGVSESYLLFSYRKAQVAAGDARIVASVEVSEDLAGAWLGLDGLPGVVVFEEPNAAAAGVDMVRVYLPMSLARNGSLFARLAVSELAP